MILRTYLKLLFSSLSNRANWLCINKTLMHYYINQTNSVTISLSGSEFCKNKSRSYSLSFYLSVIWNKLECQHY